MARSRRAPLLLRSLAGFGGVDVSTALELTPAGGSSVGDSVVAVLDGRQATVGTGTNGAVRAQWVILDTYANGGTIAP